MVRTVDQPSGRPIRGAVTSAKARAGFQLDGKGKAWFSLSSRIKTCFSVIDPGATSRRCGFTDNRSGRFARGVKVVDQL
ncbi:hypothetical protein KAJ77_00230 [bacterium]|nr:hypothetical protein [bacterium]